MSSLQENLLNSIEILAKGYMQQAPGTTVIEGVIQQIVNAGTGHYIISYLDNFMDVYANNPNIQFNIGDKVYVLIPNGDFSKQKVIISMSTPSTMLYDSSELDKYMEVSDNLLNDITEIKLSTYKTETIVVKDVNENWYGNFKILFPKYLKNYSTFLFSADIKTSIKTEQQINGNYGIKLQLPFYFYDSEKIKVPTWKTYILDVNNISGNPYRLTEWSNQNIFIQLSSEEIYDTDREPYLEVFVKDFAQNEDLKDIKDIQIRNITFHAYDILSEDQQQGYYLHLKASEGNYFFTGEDNETKILTPTLKANGRNVKLNTQHVSIEDSYQCYWFIEDAAIKEDSELYSYVGGIGWRCLNDKANTIANEDGSISVEFVTNSYTYEVKAKDVLTSARYKCVIVVIKQVGNNKTYSTTVSTILKLENLKASIDMSVNSITGSNSYIKNIGEVGLKCTIIDNNKDFFSNYTDYAIMYEWNRYDKNNTYIDNNFYTIKTNDNIITEDEHIISQQISLPTNLIEDSNIFTCSAYISYIDNDSGVYKKVLLGTESILINTNGSATYNLSIQNGDVLYKYDVDGDSPLSEKYDGPLDSKIAMVKPLTYTIYKADGTEFTDSEYAYCKTTWLIPKNSLITFTGEKIDYDSEYYKFEGVGRFEFNYTLASKYNFKKINNVIRLKINYGDIELNADAAIKVLKEGENGTNNTNYSIVITHNDAAYNEKKNGINQKLQAIYCNEKWYYHDLENNTLKDFAQTSAGAQQLSLKLYESGEEIKIDTEKVSIEWTLFDPEVTESCIGFVDGEIFNESSLRNKVNCLISPYDEYQWNDNQIPVNIIQVKVNIEDKTELYAYYPIEVVKVDDLSYIKRTNVKGEEIYIIPTCVGGFSSVLYASDGTNPQYNSSEPFTCIDSVFADEDFNQYYTYEWSSNDNGNLIQSILGQDEKITNQAVFRPVAKYDSSNTKNYVAATLTLNNKTEEEIKTQIEEQKVIYDDNIKARDNINIEKENISLFLSKAYEIKNKDQEENLEQEQEEIKSINTLLENSKSYLQAKAKILNSLTELEVKYQEFLTFYDTLRMGENTLDEYINYQEVINILFQDIRMNSDLTEELELKKINLKKNEVINLVKKYFGQKPKEGESNAGGGAVAMNEIETTPITTTSYEQINFTSVGTTLFNFITSYNEQLSIFSKDYDNYSKYNIVLQDETSQSKLDFLILIFKFVDIINLIADEDNYLTLLKKQLTALSVQFNIDSTECVTTYTDVSNLINEAFNLISYYGNEEGTLSEVVDKDLKDKYQLYADAADAAFKEYTRLQIFLADSKEIITYIRPIVMTYNRYSLSAISGWDGNRLYTGTGNTGDYLYTPQVGAGVKNNDGSFTGIVIGHKKEGTDSKVGLFGFGSGKNSTGESQQGGIETIFLDANTGQATFGQSGKGQIVINPGADNTSTIAGWEINTNSLSKTNILGNITGTVGLYSDIQEKVKIGEVEHPIAFRANSTNHQALITYDGWFKSNYGNIGGWTIDKESISSELDVDDARTLLKKDGTIECKNLIANKEGEIAGWKISSNSLTSANIQINANGSIKHFDAATNTSQWSINSSGAASFSDVYINGVQAGSAFGGVSINSSGQTGGDFVSKFEVSGTAKNNFNNLVADKVDANYVGTKALEAGFITADTIAAKYATFDYVNAVDAKFNNLNADNITSGTLSADRIDVGSLKIGQSQIIVGNTHATTATGGTMVKIRCMAVLPGTSGWQEQEFYVYKPSSMKKLYTLKIENA